MRLIYFISFILLYFTVNVNCGDGEENEFITVIAPEAVFEKKDYNLVLFPSNVAERTEVAFNFRKSYATTALQANKMQKFKIKNTKGSGSKLKFDLKMTVLRNNKCVSHTIQEINSVKDQFYTFIQTDKPIYKPGDEVKFRVLMLDKDLKPYHINNINVNITDPLERIIETFEDPGSAFAGVFNQTFKISPVTALGIWKIRIIIDKKPQFLSVKTFNVQKYTLPPFAAHIEVNEKHVMTNFKLELKIYGKYSFGEYVPGDAQLIIREAGYDKTKVYFNQTFRGVSGVTVKHFKPYDDLKIITSTEKEIEAEVIFTEAESGIVDSSKVRFTVHGSAEKKLIVERQEKFMAGLPFGIKVRVMDWNHKIIKKSPDSIEVVYELKKTDENTQAITAERKIENGVITHSIVVPEDIIGLTLKVRFINTRYEEKVEMGQLAIGVSKIKVNHLPQRPSYNESVTIYVKSDTELDQIIAVIMTRHGSVSSHQQYCNYKKMCKYNFRITRDMMPLSKVVIYHIENHYSLHKGETIIETDEISANTLSIAVPATATPKQSVDISFSTKKSSEIFLLAYDKRLTSFGTDNEVKKNDVVNKLIDYDGNNVVKVYKMENWHACSKEEMDMIKKGRQLTTVHGGETFTGDEDFDDSEFDTDDEGTEPADTDKGEEKDDIRQDFPDVWIYDNFKAASSNVTRTYRTPDSITSWKFSAFAMNKEGLAIAEPKELIVKKEFFVRTNLPYSIRYNEVLKLDILIHNYHTTREPVTVTVDLLNLKGKEFQFVTYRGCAISSTNSDLKSSQTITVPHDLVKKVTFYIRSYTNTGKDEYAKLIKLRVDATAKDKNGNTFSDKILKKLRVDPIGVKKYDITNVNYQLTGKEKSHSTDLNFANGLKNNIDEFPRIRMEILGDFLSDTINVSPTFNFYPSGCTEQRTSKLKAFVEYVKYLKARGKPVPNEGYAAYYQGLLQTRRACTYYIKYSEFKSYYIDALASGMFINILPVDKGLIQIELDQLKALQRTDGTFVNYGGIIPSHSGGTLGLYYQTAYCLIPFIKFRSWIGKNYDDVINKGIDYIKNEARIKEQEGIRDGLVVAAYISALSKDTSLAKKFLATAEKDAYFNDPNSQKKRCLKRISYESCDLRHTAYAAITYLLMDDQKMAQPLIIWLMDNHSLNKAFSNSRYLAIASEAISTFVSGKPVKKATDFTVKITNEHDYNKITHMNSSQMGTPIEVQIPEYTLNFTTAAKGTGFCSITTVIERIVAVKNVDPKFTLTVVPRSGSTSTERIIQVCATYVPLETDNSLQTLVNVIYDVEMPSGYQYVEIVNLASTKAIRLAESKQLNTKVIVYFNDFNKNTRYCVDIKAKKLADIRDIRQAGVIVYDYENKENIAVDFYTFTDSCKA